MIREDRAARRIKYIIVGVFTVMMVSILFIVVYLFGRTTFIYQRHFLLRQKWLLMLGCILLDCVCVVMQCTREKQNALSVLSGKNAWIKAVFWLGLLLIQICMSWYAYFLTGWDARYILERAYNTAIDPLRIMENDPYFSQYSNNILVTLLYRLIMMISFCIAGRQLSIEICAYILIVLQCAINTCTGILSTRVARKMTGSQAFSDAIALVYVVFIGISPWVLIPYTDSTGLIIPILMIWIYQSEIRFSSLKGMIIGILGAVGYRLKPQLTIVFIAIVCMESVVSLSRAGLSGWLRRLLPIGLSFALAVGPFYQGVLNEIGVTIDPTRGFGLTHYAMVGINRVTTGTYSPEDVEFSREIEDPQERVRMQIETIRERLHEMGVTGFAELMKKKTLVNYGDGTFAWAIEGEFYRDLLPNKDTVFSPFFKDLLERSSGRFAWLASWMECIWLTLLFGCCMVIVPFRIAMKDGEKQNVLCVILLSIIGLTVFEWIFEARARYLYTYAPFYVLAGMSGLWYTMKAIGRALRRRGMPGST